MNRDEAGSKMRWLRRTGWTVGGVAGLLAFAGLGGGLWLRHGMQEDLPQVSGQRRVAGLVAPVSIDRDALGVPAIRGASRRDVAFATGFVHAQDRLFQMDILRRRSAGRLSELIGGFALETDVEVRKYGLSARARQALASSPPEVRSLLAAYAAGVNAGRASLDQVPFEYLLLRGEPEPWKPEDSFLVLLTMYLQQAGPDSSYESTLALMHDRLPAALFAFLTPIGTEWDAPLVGGLLPAAPLPSPETVDLRRRPAVAAALTGFSEAAAGHRAASNAWAVDSQHSATGGAMLANDLHLNLSIPNLWYRASLSWPSATGALERVTGVTLPGAPVVVVGSNGHVAWGVTNAGVDVSDLILLDSDRTQPDTYLTPDGPRRFDRHREIIHLRGGGEKAVDVTQTVWGPVVGRDPAGRLRAVRWVALEKDAVNFDILGLEGARNIGEALAVAHRSGVPALNFVAADDAGHIAWSVMGRLPRRIGFDGRLPASWADGSHRWDGLVPPDAVPQVVDPAPGRLWSSNQRVVDGEGLAKLGDGGYRLAARAHQVRDALLAMERPTAEDLRRLQLDDRALFLQRWHDLMLSVLTPQAIAKDPRRRELRALVEAWGSRAAIDSAGYRMVRTFRSLLAQSVFDSLTAPCRQADPSFSYTENVDQWEGPLWALVVARPPHLLNPRYATWNDQVLAIVDQMMEYFGTPLRDRTWGERNTTAIRHRLSRLLPGAGHWLDMVAQQLPGDDHMPRVQAPEYGATLRMVVSPGHEDLGFFTMPGGQSGNPLSPHYRDSHPAWASGRASPFLPGPAVHHLELEVRSLTE
jgi:penicillin amidase